MSAAPVRLARTDAYLLAAPRESGGRQAHLLRDLVADYEWLERGIPAFDEAGFGLPRLAAAGFLDVGHTGDGQITVRAKAKARALRAWMRATTLGGVLSAAEFAVGAAPYPESEVEDRSLGRLAGLAERTWDAGVQAYRVAFARQPRTCLVAHVLGAAAAIASAAAVLRRSRRRE